jgi:hypothetical protein
MGVLTLYEKQVSSCCLLIRWPSPKGRREARSRTARLGARLRMHAEQLPLLASPQTWPRSMLVHSSENPDWREGAIDPACSSMRVAAARISRVQRSSFPPAPPTLCSALVSKLQLRHPHSLPPFPIPNSSQAHPKQNGEFSIRWIPF